MGLPAGIETVRKSAGDASHFKAFNPPPTRLQPAFNPLSTRFQPAFGPPFISQVKAIKRRVTRSNDPAPLLPHRQSGFKTPPESHPGRCFKNLYKNPSPPLPPLATRPSPGMTDSATASAPINSTSCRFRFQEAKMNRPIPGKSRADACLTPSATHGYANWTVI